MPYLLPQPRIYQSAESLHKKGQPPGLKYQWLLCFVTAVEEGQLSRAAARLNLSQASLRLNLAQLESHLNLKLWDSIGKQLSLHPGALFLYERAQAILAQVAALKAPLQTQQETEVLRIEMASPWVCGTPLSVLQSWLSELWGPSRPLNLYPAQSQHQGNPALRLKDKRCDFVLHSLPPTEAGLRVLAGPRSEFCLVNNQAPLGSFLPEKLTFAQLTTEYWPPEIHASQIQLYCPDLYTLKQFLLAGPWSSWLPDILVAPELNQGHLFKQPYPFSPAHCQFYLWGLPETFKALQLDI